MNLSPAVACFAVLGCATITAAADELLMVFRDKPPYSYVEKGSQRGFLLERTRRIMERAGIATTFIEMPPKRIFAELQENARPICSFGWYRIPEREKYARFSLPIHRDRPHVVLAGKHSANAIRRHKTLKGLFNGGSLTLAVADGVSYGPELDALIAGYSGRIDRSLLAPLQVAKMIAAKRADFMLIDQEDYDHLQSSAAEFSGDELIRVEFPDQPPGLRRYILCSQRVELATMKRIDAAIDTLKLRP